MPILPPPVAAIGDHGEAHPVSMTLEMLNEAPTELVENSTKHLCPFMLRGRIRSACIGVVSIIFACGIVHGYFASKVFGYIFTPSGPPWPSALHWIRL